MPLSRVCYGCLTERSGESLQRLLPLCQHFPPEEDLINVACVQHVDHSTRYAVRNPTPKRGGAVIFFYLPIIATRSS
jgi:hypothetical protein